jgi:hypothetical protein
MSAECAAEASLTLQLLLAGARDTKAHDRARILDVAGVRSAVTSVALTRT